MSNTITLKLGKLGRIALLKDLRTLINTANTLGLEGNKIDGITFPKSEMLTVVLHYETTKHPAPEGEESASSSPAPSQNP